jgi:hypothetical protein
MQQETESPLTPLGQAILAGRAGWNCQPEPPPDEARPPHKPAWLLLAWLAVPFLLADLALCPVMSLEINLSSQRARNAGVLLTAFLFGVMAWQAVLLSMYMAFSTDPWWQRLAIFIPLAIMFSAAGLLGMAGVHWSEGWEIGDEQVENGVRLFCALPLVALAGIVPFIFFRWVFDWAMIRTAPLDSGPNRIQSRRPASILNMMLLTAAIAGGFGLIRIAPIATLVEPGTLWVIVGVFAGIAAGFSTLGGIPLLVLCHYVKRSVLRGVIVLVILLVSGLASLAVYAWFTPWPEFIDNAPFNSVVFSTIVLTFLGGLSCCLMLFHYFGWTIQPAQRSVQSAKSRTC